MPRVQRPYIAREGWPYIATAIICAAVAQYLAGIVYSALLWIVALVVIYLFRDPDRPIPAVPLAVVSPVDGRLEAVEENAMDPFLQRTAAKVTIRMRRRGTYTMRSPIEGKIMKQWLASNGTGRAEQAGSVGAQAPGDGEESHGIWIQSDEDDDVVLAVRVGRKALRPTCYVRIGERAGQGQRCGLVPFGGAMVTVWLPSGTRLEVSPGDKVRSGADIVATFMR